MQLAVVLSLFSDCGMAKRVVARMGGMVDMCGRSVACFAYCRKTIASILQNCCVGQCEWVWEGMLCELVGFYSLALHLPVKGASIDI